MEISEVCKFLASTTPFDHLPGEAITMLARSMHVSYCRAQEQVPTQTKRLLLVRTGVFSLFSDQQQLLAKLQAGDYFGYQQLLTDLADNDQLICEEDGLVYWLPADVFAQFRGQYKHVELFFQRLFARRLHQYREQAQHSRFTLKVADVVRPGKISIDPQQSVQQAASLMTAQRVSSLLVEQEQRLAGILTDRDLRSRVLALGLPATTPVAQVMTAQPYSIDNTAFLYEAVQLMSRHNIHHLPVLANGSSIGMLTTTDLIRAQQDHPVYLIGELHRQPSIDALEQCCLRISELLQTLHKQQLPAHEVSHMITTITDALTQRLIALAQQQLGEPPCVFSWLAFGSQARMDQSLNADQDNALLLEKQPEGDVANYFSQLADFVCQGLARCGIRLCPGNIMASNPELRLSLQGFSQRFAKWLHTPTPQALLNSSIFFDMRVIDGSRGLFNALQQDVLQKTGQQDLFLMHLARGALERTAPLGFLKNFILEQDGKQKKGLDLKKRGLSLITDLTRVYALSAGISEVNTRQRLQKLMELQAIDVRTGQDLLDAFDVLSQLRWEKHAQELTAGHDVTNLLDPAGLSSLQRHQLKDCFAVINQAQSALRYRFCREF